MIASAWLRAAASTLVACGAASAQEIHKACIVRDVSVFQDRAHLLCEKQVAAAEPSYDVTLQQPQAFGLTVIVYFAVPMDSPFAPLFVSVATAAQTTGRVAHVTAASSSAENPPGCAQDDCRLALSLRLE